jgi:hypothetical protein
VRPAPTSATPPSATPPPSHIPPSLAVRPDDRGVALPAAAMTLASSTPRLAAHMRPNGILCAAAAAATSPVPRATLSPCTPHVELRLATGCIATPVARSQRRAVVAVPASATPADSRRCCCAGGGASHFPKAHLPSLITSHLLEWRACQVRAAFEAYEAPLEVNDLGALDEAFWRSAKTLRLAWLG